MVSEHHLSERRACRLVGLSRDSYLHPPQPDQATLDLHEKIIALAHGHRRFGYRRIHDLLRPQLPSVNHKRVYRLYRQANLAVRRSKKSKRPVNERVPLQLARTVNEVVKAQTNKVRLARLKGDLVDRSQAIAHVFRLARTERDAWLNWPARTTAQMAAKLDVDAHALHIAIEAAVREHLMELGELRARVD